MKYVLMFLMMCSVCFGADVWVNPAGSNTSPYETEAKGIDTIQNALDYIDTTGAGTYNVYIVAGTYVETENTFLWFKTGLDDTTIVMQPKSGVAASEVILAPTTANNAVIFDAGITGSNITMKNMTITPTDATNSISLRSDTSIITLDGLVVTSPNGNNDVAIDEGLAALTSGHLIIKNCTITASYAGINIAGYVNGTEGNIVIENNIITVTAALGASVSYGIRIGSETHQPASFATNKIAPTLIKNNVINFTGDFSGAAQYHGILVGYYSQQVKITGNTIISGEPCIAFKSDYGLVEGNTCIANGGYGLAMKGTNYTTVCNNTVIPGTGTPTGPALNVLDNFDAAYPTSNCDFYNNIFDGGSSFAKEIENGHDDNRFNYNALYTTGTNIMYLGGANVTDDGTITPVQTAWLAESDSFPYNEADSIVVNPQADSNGRAKNTALKNAGTPLILKSDGTVVLRNDIGATKFADGGYRSRYR